MTACTPRIFRLTLQGPSKIAADDTFIFYFHLLKKIWLDVTCECSVKRDSREISHYFIRKKTMKKYSRLSSAAVVIGALRVKK